MTRVMRTPPLSARIAAHEWRRRHELLVRARSFRGRHHAAAITVVLVVVFVAFQLFPRQDVTVLSNGQSVVVSATFDIAEEALEAAAVPVTPGDELVVAEDGRFASVAVRRARTVFAEVDGTYLEVHTRGETVGGALAEAGVSLAPGDRVYLEGEPASPRAPLTGVRVGNRSVPAESFASRATHGEPLVVTVVRAHPYSVFVDTREVEARSAAATVAGLVEDIGLTVREGDLVSPPLETPLEPGMTVHLAKARTVNVRLNGKDTVLYTQARTVAGVMDVLGIDAGRAGLLSLPAETRVSDGMSLLIGTSEVVREDVVEPWPPPESFEEDPSLPRGEVRIVHGEPGEVVVTYESTFENGELLSRSAVARVITRAPVATRHITGTRATGAGSPAITTPEYSGSYSKKVQVWATWYNASHGAWAPGDPNYGRTATGVMLDYGICAVDPSVIPLGTRFMVPGYGMCLAADTGGGITGWKVDLGFPESAGVNPWRTGTVDIYILD